MKLDEFNYTLPQYLIATTPLQNRSQSRLMVINRHKRSLSHQLFSNILNYLTPNDVLVLNNTKVIKARLFANRKTGGSIELFLNTPITDTKWSVLLKPAKRVKEGETLYFDHNNTVSILEKHSDYAIGQFNLSTSFSEFTNRYGELPLPPYIRSQMSPKNIGMLEESYQTIYAKTPGAVAAPTAGLHFTELLLQQIKQMGVQVETITLHVGLGTFQPITTNNVQHHRMHKESYFIDPDTAARLTNAIGKKRIVAVGTTSVRTLESAFKNGIIQTGKSETQLFIYPGYQFNVVNAMITNFHLPKSSLLLLISAFSGTSLIQKAYSEAIEKEYRFYSFGDAMFIV